MCVCVCITGSVDHGFMGLHVGAGLEAGLCSTTGIYGSGLDLQTTSDTETCPCRIIVWSLYIRDIDRNSNNVMCFGHSGDLSLASLPFMPERAYQYHKYIETKQ